MTRRGRERSIDDTSALMSRAVSIPERVGWVCRVARLLNHAGPITLQEMAERVGTNPTRLHRLEHGVVMEWSLVERYEAVLGLAEGSLLGPFLLAARTPVTRPWAPAGLTPEDARTTSARTERLLAATSASPALGIDWLRWGHTLSHPMAVGLPERIALEMVDRLSSEMARSVGHAFPCRYEALAALRQGPYGYVVIQAATQRVNDPDIQLLFDLMSAVTELPDEDAVRWTLDLLGDSRERVAMGASFGLENIVSLSSRRSLAHLVTPLVERLDEPDTSPLAERIALLLLQMPPDVLHAQGVRLNPRSLRVSKPETWTVTPRNWAWAMCEEASSHFSEQLGVREQPMLSRMLFDAAFNPFTYVSTPTLHLLGAVPGVRQWVSETIASMVLALPEHDLQSDIAWRLAGARFGVVPEASSAWWDRDHLLPASMIMAGQGGSPPPVSAVKRLVEMDPSSVHAVFAIAMTIGVEALGRVLQVQHLSPSMSGQATWWRKEGGPVSS